MTRLMARVILHVDMDEFFAAVEKLDHPDLRGKPLLVGGDPSGRGVVSTASYEARPFGCHSAMPMATAIRLCPQAIVLPVRFERYRQLSDQVFAILERFSPLVEPLSIDEAFLDVTGCERLLGPAAEIAAEIKRPVRARDAADRQRRRGAEQVPGQARQRPEEARRPGGHHRARTCRRCSTRCRCRKIWGVGPGGGQGAREARTCARSASSAGCRRSCCRQRFGEWGEHCHRLARGLDDRPVEPDGQAKSIGQEETFPEDVGEIDELRARAAGAGRRRWPGGCAATSSRPGP